MGELWLPGASVEDFRARYATELQERVELRGMHARLVDFNRDLKRLDSHLELIKAHETADHPQLTPGYYHVLRHNPGTAPTIVLTVKGPNGEFREPDSALFAELSRLDAWSDRSRRIQEKAQQEALRIAERRREREQQERVDDIVGRLRHAHSPSVSFSDVRWSNTSKGKRGRS